MRLLASYATGAEPETLLDLISGDRCNRDAHLSTDPETGRVVVTDAQSGSVLSSVDCGVLTISLYVRTDDVAGRDVYRELTPEEHAIIEAARTDGYLVRVLGV